MRSIHYLRFFEVAMSNFTISAIGYLCGFLKMFTTHEISLILSIVNNISVPLMIFKEIGNHDLKPKTWAPLLVAFLVQVSLHLLLCLALVFHRSISKNISYIKAIFSTVYFNGIYCATPIVQVVFGDKYTYIVIYCYIIHHLFIVPLHNIIIYFSSEEATEFESDYGEVEVSPPTAKKEEKKGKNKKSKKKNDKSADEDELNDISENDKEETSQIKMDIHVPNSSEDDEKNSNSNDENINLNDKGAASASLSINGSSNINISEAEDSSHANLTPVKNLRPPFWKILLRSYLNFSNICIILGIIWSATGLKMPLFLATFTNDHEKAVMSPGIFAIGAYMWDHPFIGGNPIEITIYFLIHSVAMPLLAILFCFALNLDHTVSIIIVLIHAMPCGLIGYKMCLHYKLKLLSPTFTFFWNNLLALPVQMLWCTVINETHLFQRK